mmetsp:Transcript_7917/g.23438  ORF Transcript_7917/g.23438 Transcript_7917/m.23438 type:complete len:649 (+) Transcript_7917:486-2432(+)
MNLSHSCCRCRTYRTTDIPRTFLVPINLSCRSHDSWQHICIWAHIFGLLLRPQDLCVAVFGNGLRNSIECKRCNLLQPHNGNIDSRLLFTLGKELVVDLATAEHQRLHPLRVFTDILVRLVQDPLEGSAGPHILDARHAPLVPEQILRRDDNEGLAEIAVDLPSQAVEVVGGRRAIHDLPVALLDLHPRGPLHVGDVMRILVDLLQEPFDAAGGMLGALPVVAVGKEHDKSGLAHPLVLSGGYELIDHDLGPVDEISELRLPHDEGVGVLQAVSQFEAEDREFREDGITAGELRLRVGESQFLHRGRHAELTGEGVEGGILLLGLLILHDGVTVAERTALNVLSGDPDVIPLQKEGSVRHGLGGPPVDVVSALGHGRACLEDLDHLAVEFEIFGDRSRLHADVLEGLDIDARGPHAAVLPGTFEALPLGTQPVVALDLVGSGRLEVGLVTLERELSDLVELLLRRGPLLDEALLENVQGGGVLGNLLVQFGLRKHGLIELVVSVAAVAYHIDNDVGSPLVPPLDGGLDGGRDREGIVAVAVEDGRVERLAEVGAIGGGTGMDGVGRETDLIVHDDVDGTPDVEVGNAGELHRLVDDALSGEGGVAVEEDGDDISYVLGTVAAVHLLRSCLPRDDRIDALEMGGVGHQT